MSQQINLFTPAFQPKRERLSALTMAVVLALALAGMAGTYGYLHWQLGGLQRQAARQGTQLEQLRAQLARISAQMDPRRTGALLEREIRHTEAALAARRAVLAQLQGGELGDTRGFSAYLRAFAAQAVNGLWLTGFGISRAGSEITLSGRALGPDLVPRYISRLGHEAVMRGKTFSSLEMRLPPAAAKGKTARFIEFSITSKEAGVGK